MTKTCRECAAAFDLEWPQLSAWVEVCPTCSERHAIEEDKKLIAQSKAIREANWERICPVEFQATEPLKLPYPKAFSKARLWVYGPKGLVLHGPTGSGKSRIAWWLSKREYDSGRAIIALGPSSGINYASKFGTSTVEAARWVERVCAVDLVLLDDVFKSRLTDSFESALFSIIDQRTERRLPVIVTANDTGESLISRMSADRGEPMVRRLREFCQSICMTDK